MISLILPKLIRSVARVGIWAFNKWLATGPDRWLLVTTQGKDAAFKRELAETQATPGGVANVLFSNLELSLLCLRQIRGGGAGPPPQRNSRLLYFDLAAGIF